MYLRLRGSVLYASHYGACRSALETLRDGMGISVAGCSCGSGQVMVIRREYGRSEDMLQKWRELLNVETLRHISHVSLIRPGFQT